MLINSTCHSNFKKLFQAVLSLRVKRFAKIFLMVYLMMPASLMAVEATYVGVEGCMMCHLPHFESWGKTKMSKVFELLKPGVRAEAKKKAGIDPNKDYTEDEFCLMCHTTGYGEPGGFVSIDETPELVGVQCEMCHGPGSIYSEMMFKKRGTYTIADYMKKGGLTMPSKDNNVCVKKCHNVTSPFVYNLDFNFEDRKAIGTHRHDLRYIDLPFDL